MVTASILKRFLVALVSVAMLLGAAPSFATATPPCCKHMNSSVHAATMHAPCSKDNGVTKDHGMPCKPGSAGCAYVCGASASVGLTFDSISLITRTVAGAATWNFQAVADGISRPPALPPPILSA